MPQLGVLFDIGELDGGLYGYAAYRILFDAVDPRDLRGCTLKDGDTNATLHGRANQYCIAVESPDSARIAAIRNALSACQTKGLLPRGDRFLEDATVGQEPLVIAGHVTGAGELVNCQTGWVQSAWKESLEAHQARGSAASAPPPSGLAHATPATPTRAKRKLDCNKCGGRMRIDNEGVYVVGGGAPAIVKLRCDRCDITRLEDRPEIESELAAESAHPTSSPSGLSAPAPAAGSPIAQRCPNCGAEAEPKATFCMACGSRLLGGAPAYPGLNAFPPTYAADGPYAGFWRRFLAYIIDYVVVVIGGMIAAAVSGGIIGGVMGVLGVTAAFGPNIVQGVAGFFGFVSYVAVFWLYFTLMESSSRQATLGKMVIGIVVTDLNGARISFGRANGRFWGKIVSGLILGIGYIMAGFSERKQALHDTMAGTLVLKKEFAGQVVHVPRPQFPRAQPPVTPSRDTGPTTPSTGYSPEPPKPKAGGTQSQSGEIAALIRDLQHGDQETALRAGSRLGTIGNPAVIPLLEAVGDRGMLERLRLLMDRGEWRESDAGLLILELVKGVMTSRFGI